MGKHINHHLTAHFMTKKKKKQNSFLKGFCLNFKNIIKKWIDICERGDVYLQIIFFKVQTKTFKKYFLPYKKFNTKE